MERIVLQTKQLTKRYKGKLLIDNVNMTIELGSIYGLIGLNGAGKTTFLRLITGLIQPTSGHIQLFGQMSRQTLLEARRKMGILIERPAFYPHLSAYENLKVIRLSRGIPSKHRIHEVLEKVGLDQVGRQKIKSFSLGMQQRLGIAMALLNQPDFLILDEPINGLDPIGVIEVRELLKSLNEQYGVTILITSHILSEVYQVATHYGIIHQGQLIQQLSAKQLDDKCQEYLLIKVQEPEIAITLIENELETIAYKVLPDGFIQLFNYVDQPSYVMKTFYKHQVAIEQLTPQKDTLESYFKRMIEEETV